MSTVINCSNDGISKFPGILTMCINKDGFSTNDLYEIINGFGDKYVTTKDTFAITASVRVMESSDMQLFAHWYFSEINRGLLPFTINVLLFGIKRDWKVTMKNKLNESDFKSMSRNITLDLEVMDDVASIVENSSGNLLCNIC